MKPLKRVAIVSNATKQGAVEIGEELRKMTESTEWMLF